MAGKARNKRPRSKSPTEDKEVVIRATTKTEKGPETEAKKRPEFLVNEQDQEIAFKRPRLDVDVSDEPEKQENNEPRRSPNGFILPDPLPPGFVIKDNRGDLWSLGQSIGLGGFGEIYEAGTLGKDGSQGKKDYVVKVEPHTNGPLFMEISFYLKAAKKEFIDSYLESKREEENEIQFNNQSQQNQPGENNLHLGLAHFVASGSLEFNDKRFRFLVLPRYGTDLQSIMDSTNHCFTSKTACSTAIQVLDALEFIHSKGYIHKDVKGSNLLLGRGEKDKHHVYLVDFGLCSRFLIKMDDGTTLHKPFQPDRRWAHEGTMEYTARDFHLGCFSRRGDIEVLFYNLIEWMGGRLPWDLPEEEGRVFEEGEPPRHYKPEEVHHLKDEAFAYRDDFLRKCFPESGDYPKWLFEFMEAVANLGFEDSPDYDDLRRLLSTEMNACGSGLLDEVVCNIEIAAKPNKNSKQQPRKGQQQQPRRGGSIVRKSPVKRHVPLATHDKLMKDMIRKQCEESLLNPTPSMLEVMARMKAANSPSKRQARTPKRAKRRLISRKFRDLTPSALTPEMKSIIDRRTSKEEEDAIEEEEIQIKDHHNIREDSSQSKMATPKLNDDGTPKSSPRVVTNSAASAPRRRLNFGVVGKSRSANPLLLHVKSSQNCEAEIKDANETTPKKSVTPPKNGRSLRSKVSPASCKSSPATSVTNKSPQRTTGARRKVATSPTLNGSARATSKQRIIPVTKVEGSSPKLVNGSAAATAKNSVSNNMFGNLTGLFSGFSRSLFGTRGGK